MIDQLQDELLLLDQDIEQTRQEIYAKIVSANTGVEASVERGNMRRIIAAAFNGIGGLFQIYSTASATTTQFDTPLILRLVARALRRGTQVALSIRGLKPVEQSCGMADYDRVQHQFAIFFHLRSLFDEYRYVDPVEYHPEVLKLMACEFGDAIKQSLACLTTTSSGRALNSAIDRLVLAINTRISFTTKVMEFP